MSELTVDPEIPYVGKIPISLEAGRMCRIQGVALPNSDRFNINLQTGPTAKPRDDTALHISVRLNQGYIARNSYENGEWAKEEGSGNLPIGLAQAFEILILADVDDYKLAINGQHFCEFRHRIPIANVNHLLIDGDVKITLISWEHSVPQNAVSESSVNASATQQFNAGPQAPPNAYQGPPQGGPPPQGYYAGPPPQYGAQPPYGPPLPPGANPHEESGFSNFLEQAQSALAGAIASGAAQKLLGGLLSSGDNRQQGYAPQNAKYGLYPDLPPADNTSNYNAQNTHTRGPLESFLSGLLSNTNEYQRQGPPPNNPPAGPGQPGNYQNYNQGPNAGPPPQYQHSQSVGGDSVLSGILSNLIPNDQNNSQQPQPQQPQNQQNYPPPQGPQGNFPPSQGPQGAGQPNVAYGQYPAAPPQQQQGGRGPLESLLSGILPSGNQQQQQQSQPHLPHVGGEGSIGGLGSMGGILSNLAGQILHNPGGNQTRP